MLTIHKIGNKWQYRINGMLISHHTYSSKNDAIRNGKISLAYYARLEKRGKK